MLTISNYIVTREVSIAGQEAFDITFTWHFYVADPEICLISVLRRK